MIKIIKTHHFFSKEQIIEIIRKENPDIITVELCEKRFNKYFNGKKYKEKGLITKAKRKTEKIGTKLGYEYGGDMNNAIRQAHLRNIPYKLIDRDYLETLEELKEIPFKEKIFHFLSYLLTNKKKVKREIEEANEVIKNKDQMKEKLEQMERLMPETYRILVKKRNKILEREIKQLENLNPEKKIVCFVGGGHGDFLKERLEK